MVRVRVSRRNSQETERYNELSGSRGWAALVFEARPSQWQARLNPSRCFRDLSDQHRRVHVSETRQHAWYPKGYAWAPREAVSSSLSLSLSLALMLWILLGRRIQFLRIGCIYFGWIELNHWDQNVGLISRPGCYL